jgi:hypothetical protein
MTVADRVQFRAQSAFGASDMSPCIPFLSRLTGSGDYAGRATERRFAFDREIGATKQ